MSDFHLLSATEAQRRIRAGRLSPQALLEACEKRIAEREPVIRALSWHDSALSRAQLGRSGRLTGLPIGVKDVIDTCDMPSEYGSPIWAGHQPRADAAAVALARAQGAIAMAKTVTTEFAVREPGPTTNPHNPEHTPGGSSSGSAAGVADFFFPLAIGTQTAGSIIRPAAYCGVVGYKPSFGLIPRMGMKLMAESLDTIGVLTRTVADAALFASVMSHRDLGDPETKPDRAPRIGICRSPVWSESLPETRALFDALPAILSRAGARVSACELPGEFAEINEQHAIVQYHESALSLSWELHQHAESVSPGLRELLGQAEHTGGMRLQAAYDTLARLRRGFDDVLGEFDVLLTPAAPGEAPKGLSSTGNAVFNRAWTALHVPCVSVPAGRGPAGLPLGVQIVGRRNHDADALQWAQWVAAALEAEI